MKYVIECLFHSADSVADMSDDLGSASMISRRSFGVTNSPEVC